MSRALLVMVAAVLIAVGAGCAYMDPNRQHACLDPDRRLSEALSGLTLPPGTRVQDPCASGQHCLLVRRAVEQIAMVCHQHVPTAIAAAVLAFETGEFETAQRRLDQLPGLPPRPPSVAVLRARLAIHEGNLRQARRLLESESRFSPSSAAVRETLAAVFYLQGQPVEAREALDVAARLGAPAWRIAYSRGLIEESLGDLAAATLHYQEALAGNPGWSLALSRLDGLRAGPSTLKPR